MEKNEAIFEFINQNKILMDQPIIKSFLSDEANYSLFEKAICYPTEDNKKILDSAFKQFYTRVRAIKYMAKLIHFSAIEYDKKLRTMQKRYQLTLDKPLTSEEKNISLVETLSNDYGDLLEEVLKNNEDLTEFFTCKHLIRAIEKLKPKQKLILKYKYIYNLKNFEIAELFNDTPQNISKINIKTLKKIKGYIEEGRKSNGEKRNC